MNSCTWWQTYASRKPTGRGWRSGETDQPFLHQSTLFMIRASCVTHFDFVKRKQNGPYWFPQGKETSSKCKFQRVFFPKLQEALMVTIKPADSEVCGDFFLERHGTVLLYRRQRNLIDSLPKTWEKYNTGCMAWYPYRYMFVIWVNWPFKLLRLIILVRSGSLSAHKSNLKTSENNCNPVRHTSHMVHVYECTCPRTKCMWSLAAPQHKMYDDYNFDLRNFTFLRSSRHDCASRRV